MNEGALGGLRVLDFSRVLAGPLCTMLLGDLGADVIKIENPDGGDDTRTWGPPWVGKKEDRLSAYFVSVNRNKRSVTLNLKTEEGRELARQLAAQSHILVENFKVGQMAHFGLGYEDLKELNPGLIYCSITGFGQTGPYRNRPGYDFVIQAMGGLMSITGPVEGPPYKVGVAIADVIAGLYAAASILAAIRYREQTGEGQYIDVALLDTQIAALVNVASNYLVSGQIPKRYGNEHPNIVPYQAFLASDGEFGLAVGNDHQFGLLCALINRPDLARDARYATNPARVENRNTLLPLLQTIFLERPVEDWVNLLLAQGIPAGPINDLPEILNSDHVLARGLIHEMNFSDSVLRMVAMPAQLSGTPATIRSVPARLGQHTAEVLREVLQVSEAAITNYQTSNVI